ncbi:hypothetical protein B0H15DRAFT_943716 [Mycena belliarum]|uniref:Uncharacterized protein n=1 Tax=Mycena belliarum TaxID=1033014 RepID=A0AAD6UJS3_9AGAR|nr:hypothetical protein B0H15DRAFT_943716 [Mycena belliae]
MRKTRCGTAFSPYDGAIMLQSPGFDFAPLLAEAVKQERSDGDADEDPDDAGIHKQTAPLPPLDALDGIDEAYAPPAPADPWDEVDDVHPPPTRPSPPPSKRRRTTFDDMQEGKKPQKRNHRKRKEKRAKDFESEGHAPRPSSLHKHVRVGLADPLRRAVSACATANAQAAPSSTKVPDDAAVLPAAYGAYTAKNADADEAWGSKKPRSLAELVQLGFDVVQWNGFDARPIVDSRGRIFAVLAGQPRGADWATAVETAYQDISAEGIKAAFPAHMRNHRRGLFAAVNVGLSYGKGQSVPSLLHSPYQPMLRRLLSNTAIARMATFASATFQLWAPRLHRYYADHQAALQRHLPHLRPNFPRSVFSAAAFNFGPNVWTFRHRDSQNLPFGWCAIQAAGPFDATKGGHLVLWNLRLVVEFPPGALILLPSATIAHSNVPVQDGDKRISFTQFTAGGLFRYVDNGFRTEGELEAADPEEFARLAELKGTRWKTGLELLSTLDELLEAGEK